MMMMMMMMMMIRLFSLNEEFGGKAHYCRQKILGVISICFWVIASLFVL
jgi:hypothetical protein